MIWLSAENPSSLGEDTFWTWFHRNFPSQFGVPDVIDKGDVILQYSTLGKSKHPERTIALLWELHPEMKAVLGSSQWDSVLAKIYEAAATSWLCTTPSTLMLKYYEPRARVDVLPIGIDTDLFCPMDKAAMRAKHNIPAGARVGFWCGTLHPMKGFDRLCKYAKENPDVYWILAWKRHGRSSLNASEYDCVPQPMLAELMNCADFILAPGRLGPFFLVEWEAMACDVPVVVLGDRPKDFIPSDHPREDIIGRGWARTDAKEAWTQYLLRNGVTV